MKLSVQRPGSSRRMVTALGIICLLALLAVTYAPFAAHPRAHAATCATTVDIGITVFKNGIVRGSGSYTSAECLAIWKVTLEIIRSKDSNLADFSPVYGTTITRYPAPNSSAAFSPKDYVCLIQDPRDEYFYKTEIDWQYTGGLGGGTKLSNTLYIPCY